jgi:GT2 family glycosyltransferase
MHALRVAIVLVNWNGREDTLRCVNSLKSLNDTDIGVIVCDNASVDGSIAAFMDWGEQLIAGVRKGVCLVRRSQTSNFTLDKFLTIIDIGTNLGFAGANNVGIRLALAQSSVEAVWLLNNDTEVDPEALAAIRRCVAEDPSIGICGSTLIYSHDRTKVQALGVRFNLVLGRGQQIAWGRSPERLPDRAEVERSMTYVPGASMYVSRRFLEIVGLLEEGYFLFYEELDWSLRNKSRFKLAWAPDSVVYHKEGGSIGTLAAGRASDLSIYYHNVNVLRIIARFKPYLLPLSFLRLSFNTVRFLLKRDWRAARLVLLAGADFVTGYHRAGGAWLSNQAGGQSPLRSGVLVTTSQRQPYWPRSRLGNKPAEDHSNE